MITALKQRAITLVSHHSIAELSESLCQPTPVPGPKPYLNHHGAKRAIRRRVQVHSYERSLVAGIVLVMVARLWRGVNRFAQKVSPNHFAEWWAARGLLVIITSRSARKRAYSSISWGVINTTLILWSFLNILKLQYLFLPDSSLVMASSDPNGSSSSNT